MIEIAEAFKPSYPDDRPLRGAALILHGFTESAAQIREFSKFDSIATALEIAAYYPQGVMPWDFKTPFWRSRQMNRLVEISQDLKIQYLVGFSAGAYMGASLLLGTPWPYRTAILYAGRNRYEGEYLPSKGLPLRCLLLRNGMDQLVKPLYVSQLGQSLKKIRHVETKEITLAFSEPPTFSQPSLQFAAERGHFWDTNANEAIVEFCRD